MSLTPLVIAFVLVAVVFTATSVLTLRWAARDPASATRTADPERRIPFPTALRAVWPPAAAEAFCLTLLAALWFGSLGHGGWVLLFLLLGALAGSADRWLRHRLDGAPAGGAVRYFLACLLKYLVAGGLCVWWLT
ncbi:MAG TPA: hypothetical protein VMT77_09975 [Gemmatimonadales bacterium]|nr:hypothetical protein [Gemmatimonadales bacterium]